MQGFQVVLAFLGGTATLTGGVSLGFGRILGGRFGRLALGDELEQLPTLLTQRVDELLTLVGRLRRSNALLKVVLSDLHGRHTGRLSRLAGLFQLGLQAIHKLRGLRIGGGDVRHLGARSAHACGQCVPRTDQITAGRRASRIAHRLGGGIQRRRELPRSRIGHGVHFGAQGGQRCIQRLGLCHRLGIGCVADEIRIGLARSGIKHVERRCAGAGIFQQLLLSNDLLIDLRELRCRGRKRRAVDLAIAVSESLRTDSRFPHDPDAVLNRCMVLALRLNGVVDPDTQRTNGQHGQPDGAANQGEHRATQASSRTRGRHQRRLRARHGSGVGVLGYCGFSRHDACGSHRTVFGGQRQRFCLSGPRGIQLRRGQQRRFSRRRTLCQHAGDQGRDVVGSHHDGDRCDRRGQRYEPARQERDAAGQ